MIKKGIIAVLLAGATCAFADNIIDEIVWVVGDAAILKSDVENAILDFQREGEAISGDPYCVIPEQLAVQKLYLHQAELDSVEISESQINEEINFRLNNWLRYYGSEERIQELTGKSVKQWRTEWRPLIRDKGKIETVQRNLVKGIKVTPAEVRNFMKDIPQDSLPIVPTQVEVQILTETPLAPRSEIERVETRLREFTARVNSGESSFANLARMYSQDGSARYGGELGMSPRTQLAPEFANVAFALTDPAKVSRIVRTEFGYHIIQLIAKKDDMVNVRHIILKPEIPDSVYRHRLARLDSIRADILAGKFTFEEAVPELSDDKETRNNQGIMVNKGEDRRTNKSRFEMQELPADVAVVVDKMKVGEISKPFILTNDRGQKVVAIVKLKDRIEQHRASVEKDFAILTNLVLQKKQNEFLQNWIKEKQKTTYVSINKNWRNCQFQYPNWIK